ncbi:MAG: VOC family protein [Vulcanimicrobiota bacterium]
MQAKPGQFCWVELLTTAPDASSFYSQLFGWSTRTLENQYTEFVLGEEPVGGLVRVSDPQVAHWACTVAVEDLDASLAVLEAAGGRVIEGPEGALGLGRAAWVEDPQGGRFSLWQGEKHFGASAGATGHFLSCDLACPDAEKAGAFYARVFGWRFFARKGSGSSYYSFALGEQRLGTVAEFEGLEKSCWTVTFATDDLEGQKARAEQLGAEVNVPVFTSPLGRTAGLVDPHGHVFGLVEPSPA